MAGFLQNIGVEGLIFGPISIEFGPKGHVTHFTVTCKTLVPLINYYNYIVKFGASGRFLGCDVGVDMTTGAEEKKLEVSLPGLVNNLGAVLEELYFDSWELVTNEISETIFINPLICSWLTANDKDVLSMMSRDGSTPPQAVAKADELISWRAPHSIPTDPAAKQLILEIIKGQSEYNKPSYVLRHTSYCSPGSLYNSGVIGEELIYDRGQLLTEVGSGWTYNLPPRLYSKISSIPYQSAPFDEAYYYTWGWKKTISREPCLANFMVEVSTEYQLALWSNLRYGLR